MMFGSTNAFGQSTSSPFASQSVFGQTSITNNNPFAPSPVGSTSPFGSQTGGSIFGGTSTGMFGTPQTSSPFSSTTAFGASSSAAFGSTMPSFGASSTSTFGSSSPSFGGSSLFGQKPAFGGGFGSSTQTSPFGSANQQSQPAFGSGLFGSTATFGGASAQSPFSSTSSPAFGASTTSAFGSSSTPTFGANNTMGFGAGSASSFAPTSASAFGTTTAPGFGTGPGFGVSSTPVFGSVGGFGASSTPAFGASTAFGTSTTPTFGTTTATPAFGSTPAFGTSSSPSFSFGSTIGQSTSAFGSSPFGTTTASPFSSQSSPFASQATTPTFGNTTFGQSSFAGNRGGSRVVAYSSTPETDSPTGQQPGKLESISAMSVYKDKSHEELRWEDYQLGDKGGPLTPGQSSGGVNFSMPSAPSNPFASTNTLGQSSAGPFSTSVSSNPFATKPFGTTSATTFSTSPFNAAPSSNPFQSTAVFGPTASAFPSNTASSIFNTSTGSSFASGSSLFTSSAGQTSSPFGNFANTQSSISFPSTAPAFPQTSPFGQASSSFAPSTTPSFPQFNTPSTGFAFSSTPSLTTSSSQGMFIQTNLAQSTPFQLPQTSQAPGLFNNLGQTQPAGASGIGGSSSIFGQNNFGSLSTSQNSVAFQPVPVTNPFGTLPAMPQMSIGRSGTAPSVQYGISSMPVVDKAAPVRISSLVMPKHLSQRRIRLPARKYNHKPDGAKVPFFNDEEETTGAPKADAFFIPRDNPRALVIRPTDQWNFRASTEKNYPLKDASTPVYGNGKTSEAVDVPSSSGSGGKDANVIEDGVGKERGHHIKINQKLNGVHEDSCSQKDESYTTLSGHRAGEAAIVYEHGADIEALMPKLRRSDYYTEPRIQELAAKERAEPGYCRHVKDFVVGRHGYGSIKFLGETDVRRLDLESFVQFNNREVVVYPDDSKKPPVGQGLNKPAEVTLLNIKCFDKKTGRQYTEGPKTEKYKEMLKRKADDQGAEFMSYDLVKGEWKFRVQHFSKYTVGDEEEENEDGWIVLSARGC